MQGLNTVFKGKESSLFGTVGVFFFKYLKKYLKLVESVNRERPACLYLMEEVNPK